MTEKLEMPVVFGIVSLKRFSRKIKTPTRVNIEPFEWRLLKALGF
jgi:hypothetical protein